MTLEIISCEDVHDTSNDIPVASEVCSSGDDYNPDWDNSDHDEDEAASLSNHPIPSFVTEEMIAGQFLKLKEKHMLSHVAVDEVVELIQTISNHMIMTTITSVQKLGTEKGLDTNSTFFKELPGLYHKVQSPLNSLGTIRKQQSYVAKNFPYVVIKHS